MDVNDRALRLHEAHQGKIETTAKVSLSSRDDLSLAYTPGVAAVSSAIATDRKKAYDYTLKGRTVAIVSDGSSVLGLGNIGPEAALPVMEGKALLMKALAGVDAFPIVLDVHSADEIVAVVKAIAPTFGAINLEDIAAPKCFEVEDRLKSLDIPVMHDDQHATAIVVLAGLINAMKVARKSADSKVVINGAGAAGIATAKLLHDFGFTSISLLDSKGAITKDRTDLNSAKRDVLSIVSHRKGTLTELLKGADIFIGLSKGNLVSRETIASMNSPIVFAMANPAPEIMPDDAKAAGAVVMATGRSDFPNQINNVLAFPGIFKGALASRSRDITQEMKLRAAKAIASLVDPTAEKIVPDVLDERVVEAVSNAVQN